MPRGSAKDEINALKSNLYTQNAINASAANIIAHVKAMLHLPTRNKYLLFVEKGL